MAVSEAESAAANLRRIHETAFNHTTLMALQVDRGWTYLQVVMPNPFEPKLVEAQMQRFGDEVLMHHEYTKEKDRCRIGGLPLIRYTTEQRLNEIMRSFEDDGCVLNNPAHLQARRWRPLRPGRPQNGISQPRRSIRPDESGQVAQRECNNRRDVCSVTLRRSREKRRASKGDGPDPHNILRGSLATLTRASG